MFHPKFNRLTVILAAVAAVGSVRNALAGNTWTGGGATTNWSDNGNWGGATPAQGTLTFTTGGTQGTTSSDNSITAQNKLLWTGSSSWTLNQGGSTVLSLFDNGGTQAKIENQSSSGVTINLPITYAATAGAAFGEINAINGAITFGTGTLTVNGSVVAGIKMFGNNQTVTFNDTVSATGKWFDLVGLTGQSTAANQVMAIGGAMTTGDVYVTNGSIVDLNSGGSLSFSAGAGLRLGGDFTTSGNQNLALGATLALTATSGGQSFGGNINPVSGNTSGNLLVTAQNTSGTDTITGNTFLDSSMNVTTTLGGTLRYGSGTSTTSTISFQSTASRVFAVGGAGSTTLNQKFAGVTNGTDQFLVNGSGTVTVPADNSASGANLLLFNVASGTLSISAANNLGSPSVSGSGYPDKVLFGAATGTNTATLSVNGTFSYGSTTAGSILGFAINKTSASTGNTAVIDVAGSNVLTMNGAISDNGTGTAGSLQKANTGTILLTASSAYTGGTTISGGTLVVTNLSAVGTGALTNNATLDIGGTSALNLNLSSGNYTQGSGGILKLQVNNSSSFSSLQTTGTASLNGTLNVNVTGTPTADGTKFTVLNTGTRSGTFSSYTTTNMPSGLNVDTSRVEKTGQLSVVNYFNGFENVNGAWANNASTFSNNATSYVIGGTTSTPPGNAQQVVDAVNASSNAAYGKLTTSALATVGGVFPATANVGPLTHFNGDSNTFGTGFTTQADVYIDPAWAGDANGTGFDYSSAVSDNGGAFHRDFIFHVFKSGGTMYLAGNNNSDYKADSNYSQIANKIAITTAGWYTLQDTFRDDGSGVLAVDLNAYNSGGTNIYTQTVSSSLDTTGGSGTTDVIGGNNYAWFVNIDTGSNGNSLNVDNVKLLNNTGGGLAAPLALTTGTLLLNNTTLSNTTEDIGGTNPGAVTNGYDYTALTPGMTAELSGDLNIELVNGFADQITPSEQFTILEASNIAGSYNNVTDGGRVETADGSGSFLANYQTTNGQQSLVLSDFQAGSVPEPGVMVVIAAGMMAMLPRYRRRK